MSKCQFCESLKMWKQTDESFKKQYKADGTERLYHEYTVAIINRAYKKGQKRNSGRIVDYRNQGLGYRLNYCPECGVKL